jgi:hypothetical protein
MIFAALYSHGYKPYINAQAAGGFSCPVLFYLIIFTVVVIAGVMIDKKNRK